jgi:hypothetical protein
MTGVISAPCIPLLVERPFQRLLLIRCFPLFFRAVNNDKSRIPAAKRGPPLIFSCK